MINGINLHHPIDKQSGYMFSFGKPCDTLIQQPKTTVRKFKCNAKVERELKAKVTSKLTQDHIIISSLPMKEDESPCTGKFYSEPSVKDQKENRRSNRLNMNSIDSAIRNVLIGRKTKRTSEEIVLDKIKREKEQLKKQKLANAFCYQKSKTYKPVATMSYSSLTLIKPFKLSSTKSTNYLKKRMTRSDCEIEMLNKKIKSKLQSKTNLHQSTVY